MTFRSISATVIVSAFALLATPEASACVTKSGKDCDAAAAHKVLYTKKLVKLAPAGGVGSTTHSTGFDPLGVPTSVTAPAALPDQQQDFGTNPDGWFYLTPSSQHAGGFAGKPMPHRIIAILTANSERRGQPGLVNPDGSLTQHAIDIGWARTGSPVPFAIPQSAPTTSQTRPTLQQPALLVPNQVPTSPQAIPTPGTAQAPNLLPGQVLVPGQVQTSPQPTPNAVQAPNLLPGHAAKGPDRAHPEQRIDVYHPTRARVYRYQEAHKIGDPSFHLVVVGFKEPE